MKWYKHDSNAHTDAKLRRVRLKYGMEGYGLYWYCLELVAQNVEQHNLTFELEHDAELIAADTGIHYELVQEMMVFMVDLGLFERSGSVITCLKLSSRTDEYTSKLIRNLPSVPTNSGQSPDKVPPIRTEQNRLEQNRTEQINPSAWADYVQHRKEIKKKMTPLSETKQKNVLRKLSHDEQQRIVDKAVANGWTGLYLEKPNEARKSDSFDAKLARTRKAAGLD